MTAEFFDQIETEVDRGVDPATAEKTAVFRDKLLGLPTNLGVALAQNIGEAPVGSCPLAVEHPAFSKECDAGTDARDIGAPVVPLLEPRQQRRVLGNQIDGVPARRGNDDDVGFFYYAQRTVRREPQSANRLHASAVDRSCPHPELRLCGFSMQPIPNHSRRVKDFDGSDRRRSIASFKNDNDYVQKSVAISAGPVRAAWSCRLPSSHVRWPSCST